MIKINLQHAPQDLVEGISRLAKPLNYENRSDGLPVHIIQRPGNLEVSYDAKEATISYEHKIHFFRALGLLIEAIQHHPQGGKIEETPQFDFNGMMFDVSRNAVLTTQTIKKLLEHMAVMGLNGFMLYTEDVYTVPENPYFGYMRGKYSYDELKEIDDYAFSFGIEVVPCMQTLAHVRHIIKWDFDKEYTDTSDIFMVGAEKTYQLIESMIQAISAPFRTKRIHLGMDEAFYLGSGQYFLKHGFRNRFEMMNEHLNRVIAITDRLQLKPMIWSDMYFRMSSKTKDYYDREAVVPPEVVAQVNKEVQMVYWDYFHHQQEDYEFYIKRHQIFGANPIFAGGIWLWNGMTPHYEKTTITTNAGLSACKNLGVREVFATIWGDNGGETNALAALPGMQLFAEHGYHRQVSETRVKERFEICAGAKYDDFMLLTQLDLLSENDMKYWSRYGPSNPSKYLLFQDLLLGLFDKHIQGLSAASHYRKLEEQIRQIASQTSALQLFFEFYAQLSTVLSIKSELGLQLKGYYDKRDKTALAQIVRDVLPQLEKHVRLLRQLHRDLWFSTNKPQGWEVIDIRYGGVLARIDSTAYRIEQYVSGAIDRLEELDEERLYFDGGTDRKNRQVGHFNYYHDMVSVQHLSEIHMM